MTSHPEFGHDTKASDVADTFASQINGRVVVITGVSRGGIGGGAALAFGRQNPSLLILVSRTQSKLDDIIADIKAANPSIPAVRSVLVDLTSQATVRRAAEEIKALTPRIDVLVNNAGFYLTRRSFSPEGIENQLAGNHVGPFLLTNLLRDQLVAAAKDSPAGATRVVNVSSEGHRAQPFRFHDHNIEGKPVPADEESQPVLNMVPESMRKPIDGYVGFVAYGQSKTANVLFTVGLNKRFAGTGVVSYALHPGTIFTEVGRDVKEQKADLDSMLGALSPKAGIDEGASTTMVAALDPGLNEIKGGKVFLDDCQVAEAEAYAVDPEKADRLWKFSEELVKQSF